MRKKVTLIKEALSTGDKTTGEIITETGINRNTLQRILAKLVLDGVIHKPKHGLYRLPYPYHARNDSPESQIRALNAELEGIKERHRRQCEYITELEKDQRRLNSAKRRLYKEIETLEKSNAEQYLKCLQLNHECNDLNTECDQLTAENETLRDQVRKTTQQIKALMTHYKGL